MAHRTLGSYPVAQASSTHHCGQVSLDLWSSGHVDLVTGALSSQHVRGPWPSANRIKQSRPEVQTKVGPNVSPARQTQPDNGRKSESQSRPGHWLYPAQSISAHRKLWRRLSLRQIDYRAGSRQNHTGRLNDY